MISNNPKKCKFPYYNQSIFLSCYYIILIIHNILSMIKIIIGILKEKIEVHVHSNVISRNL